LIFDLQFAFFSFNCFRLHPFALSAGKEEDSLESFFEFSPQEQISFYRSWCKSSLDLSFFDTTIIGSINYRIVKISS
jgi:hypothetical protein